MSATAKDIFDAAQALVDAAILKGVRVSTAESCTGGGIGAAITDISGASAVYPGGIISYANDIKMDPLGVEALLLKAHGAVSAEVAGAMATGALSLFRSDFSVAVTGIAGPGGGSAEKPVGLVYIAAAGVNGKTQVEEFKFGDIGRSAVRRETILAALRLLTNQMHQA